MNSFPVLFLYDWKADYQIVLHHLCVPICLVYINVVSVSKALRRTHEKWVGRGAEMHTRIFCLFRMNGDRTVKDLEVFRQMGRVCCWLCCPVLISFFLFPLTYFQCQIRWWFADLIRLKHLGGLFLCSYSAGAWIQCVYRNVLWLPKHLVHSLALWLAAVADEM